MKKYGAVVALGLAVLFGVIAVVLANKWLATRVSEERVVVKEAVPLTQIVIAGKDLDIGTRLTEDAVTMADWPKANVPKGAFQNLEEVIGRITVTKMVAGKPLLASELAAPGSAAGLVALIKEGKRAMAIRVDEVVGVGGFILPNTFVDVISVSNKTGRQIAKTILERIEVLAIAQETFVEEGKAKLVRTVTLEVEPKQAEKLAQETHEGPIHLVLRNPSDEVEEKAPPVKKKVRKTVRRKPVPKLEPRVYTPKPSPHAVEIIRGSKPPEKVQFKNVESEERL